jgi:hypothetical protein
LDCGLWRTEQSLGQARAPKRCPFVAQVVPVSEPRLIMSLQSMQTCEALGLESMSWNELLDELLADAQIYPVWHEQLASFSEQGTLGCSFLWLPIPSISLTVTVCFAESNRSCAS